MAEKMQGDGQTRALLVKFGAIGDVLMVIPAAYALHQSGFAIDWICGVQVLPILQLYPWIRPIVAEDRALLKGSFGERLRALAMLWRMLGGRRYTLCATLYYDARYRAITLPVRARRKLQLSLVDRTYRLLSGRHHTDEFARILLGSADGVEPTQPAPVPPPVGNLPPTPLSRGDRQRIVLAPGGAQNMMANAILRRWPVEQYVALADALLAQGLEIVLIGGPDDDWVRPWFAALPVEDLIGRLSLTQTIALLNSGDVFVTHDTGPMHLGGVASIGIVALFGPTDPRSFAPRRPGTVALWGGEGFACRPCYDGRNFAACPSNDCMRQISTEMVLQEVMAMLKDRIRGYLAAPRILTPPSTTAPAALVTAVGQAGQA